MKALHTSGHKSVNGINMYYEVYGEGGIPLVLIHGGGSTSDSTFGRLIPLLNHQLIAVELQAHGRTSDRNAPETFEQDADDVAELLNQLSISKANFLGFSNGGTTTLQIAIRHPQIVNKLVVASANYRRDGMIDGFFEGMPHATIDHMPKTLQDAFLKVNPDKALLQNMFEKDKARMVNFKDIPDDLISAISAPVLFIVADQDVMTVAHVLAMSKLVTSSKLVVLPGTHGSYMGVAESELPDTSKLPQITAMLVEEFLAG